MPHDFGSSRDRRSASGLGAGIGFHELRQACEISALREDLERLAHEAGALRDGVERAVEEVRDRFAALSADDMTDPVALASVLQLSVATLLEIREQARRLDTRTGPLPDDERPSWLGAADAPRLRGPQSSPPVSTVPVSTPPAPSLPASAMPPAVPLSEARPASQPESLPPFDPPPPPATSSVPPVGKGQASWLAGTPLAEPPTGGGSRAAAERGNSGSGSGGPRSAGGIDWLGPPADRIRSR